MRAKNFLLLLLMLVSACKKKDIEGVKVSTESVDVVTATTAMAHGSILDLGAGISDHGFCWATTHQPTLEDEKVSQDSVTQTGPFVGMLAGLQPSTLYYVRAYAFGKQGLFYGNEVSFTTSSPGLAVMTTTQPLNINLNSADVGGNITSDGGAPVTERGICYSTSPDPTIYDDTVTCGNGTGSYTCSLSGLTPEARYFAKAYAITSLGLSYGNEVSFKPGACRGDTTVTFDGYDYRLVGIGNQCWFAENLKTTIYNNGAAITNLTDSTDWVNDTMGAWCYYKNNSSIGDTFGKLYNWYAVARNVCPDGWHVPYTVEWNLLIDALGGDAIAGLAMKDSTLWDGTNTSGFTAFPGGLRSKGAPQFRHLSQEAWFWTASGHASIDSFAHRKGLSEGSSSVSIDPNDYTTKLDGHSCRCIKD